MGKAAAANGLDLENFGMKVVKQEVKLASGKPTQVLRRYRAANVQRPIISFERAGDIEIVIKGDYIPLEQKGGLFEMGVLDATQGDGRMWAKSRGTYAAVTDGESAEVRDTVDKCLEMTSRGISRRWMQRWKCRKKSSTVNANRRGNRQAQRDTSSVPYVLQGVRTGQGQAERSQGQASRGDGEDAGAG